MHYKHLLIYYEQRTKFQGLTDSRFKE